MMKSTCPSLTNDMPGNAGFYAFDKKHIPVNVKYKPKEKYEKRVLVWFTVSTKGISRRFICSKKGPLTFILKNI